jgi:ribose-phosphate pyrophosphokinase
MIAVEADGRPVALRERLIFSGGEVQPRLLDPPEPPWQVKITAHIWSSDDLMELLLVNNACQKLWPDAARYLVMPYMPYARQDRACYEGEAFALEVAASMIAGCGFAGIEVWDPHSAKTRQMLPRLRVREAKEFVERIPTLLQDMVIIAPDEGAYQRAWQCSCIKRGRSTLDGTGPDNFLLAKKTRSSDTGTLQPPTIENGHLIKNRDCLIVDDICDGGRTFINLAKVLRPLTEGKIYLYVTHGIFSNGLLDLMGVLDHVYVANLHPHMRETPFLTVIK